MLKSIKIIIVIIVLGVSIYGGNYIYYGAPIMTGYSAKILCSCHFVSGREGEDCIEKDLFGFKLVDKEINDEQKEITTSLFGLFKSKAIYRDGYGCSLIADEESVIKLERNETANAKADSAVWQEGDAIVWPTEVDKAVLGNAVEKAFKEESTEGKKNTRALLVIHKNNLLVEKYAEGFNKEMPLSGWSMTKSVTSTLFGILVKNYGLDLQGPAGIGEWANDSRNTISIDDLLQMSSGLDFEEDYSKSSDATNMLFNSNDVTSIPLKSKLSHEPGSKWYYSSGTTNILCLLLKNRIEEQQLNYNEFPYQFLFEPLGMNSAVMEVDASGNFVGSSYMYATARDWAKFGLLYLNNGNWNGNQILPTNWVKYITTPAINSPNGNYGAQFWLNAGHESDHSDRPLPDLPEDLFYCAGYEGQYVVVVPSLDLVVVRLGLYTSRSVWDKEAFFKSIVTPFMP